MKTNTTIIYGKNSTDTPTGKSFLANQISLNYDQVIFIPGRHLQRIDDPFFHNDVDESTELIILDDISDDYFSYIISLINSDKLLISGQGKRTKVIERPAMIITIATDDEFINKLKSKIPNCKFIRTTIDDKGSSRIFLAKRV